jgi:hypothetical protein
MGGSKNLLLADEEIDWKYINDTASSVTKKYEIHPVDFYGKIFKNPVLVKSGQEEGVVAVIAKIPTGFILVYRHYGSLKWDIDNLGATSEEVLQDLEETFEQAIVAPTLTKLLAEYAQLPESRESGEL